MPNPLVPVALGAFLIAIPAAAGIAQPARTDLAETAQGQYHGDVMSDARGSSRSDVRIMVTRIGPGRVRVSSDYPRLPAFETALTRAMDTIQNQGGDALFLLDLSKSPHSLHVTVDDASWAGTREAAAPPRR